MAQTKEQRRSYYQEHKDKYKEYQTKYLNSLGFATQAEYQHALKLRRGWTPRSVKPKLPKQPKKKSNLTPADRQRQIKAHYKAQVFDMFHNRCARCGFEDARALQIDHIQGDGSTSGDKKGSPAYYKKILADQGQHYQLLCANCNWIKRYENGEQGGRKVKPPDSEEYNHG